MLDMGGIAQASANTRIDVGKNNKIRAVALDFHLITRSIEERRRLAEEGDDNNNSNATSRNIPLKSVTMGKSPPAASAITPDTSLVGMMASLLNLNLGGQAYKLRQTETDDMSAILGSSLKLEGETIATKQPSSPHLDIRTKYAAKLRNKIDGGVAGLELANSEKEATMKRGDASIHLAARNLISSGGMGGDETNPSSTRWLATTGAGKLLSFLSSRSIQIALLPLPSTSSHPQTDSDVKRTYNDMESLTKQLPNVQFDLLVPDGRRRGEEKTDRSNDHTAGDVLQNVLTKLQDVPPLKCMVVSDRDDYLTAARDIGMFTCRIRPKNARRGNITANYNVEDVGSVQEAINDVNGISFNSALKG